MLVLPTTPKAAWQTPKLHTLDVGRTLGSNNPNQTETQASNCTNNNGRTCPS